jgi:hypothetical protein
MVKATLHREVDMKAKNGYKKQKTEYSTGKWLKRYFEKFTCRKHLNESNNSESVENRPCKWSGNCGHERVKGYCLGKKCEIYTAV